jgi:hypothetical protein
MGLFRVKLRRGLIVEEGVNKYWILKFVGCGLKILLC